MSKLSIEVYYSFQSPSSYVALDSIMDLEINYDVELIWQPFSARASGQAVQSMGVLPDKLSYLFEDVTRTAKDNNLPIVFPEGWPETEFDPSRITRGALVASDMGVSKEYLVKVFDHCWGQGKDPNEDGFMNELCEQLDVDFGEMMSKASASDTKERIKNIYKRGRQLGVFDTPTLIIDKDRYFGVDKIQVVAKKLEKLGLANKR